MIPPSTWRAWMPRCIRNCLPSGSVAAMSIFKSSSSPPRYAISSGVASTVSCTIDGSPGVTRNILSLVIRFSLIRMNNLPSRVSVRPSSIKTRPALLPDDCARICASVAVESPPVLIPANGSVAPLARCACWFRKSDSRYSENCSGGGWWNCMSSWLLAQK